MRAATRLHAHRHSAATQSHVLVGIAGHHGKMCAQETDARRMQTEGPNHTTLLTSCTDLDVSRGGKPATITNTARLGGQKRKNRTTGEGRKAGLLPFQWQTHTHQQRHTHTCTHRRTLTQPAFRKKHIRELYAFECRRTSAVAHAAENCSLALTARHSQHNNHGSQAGQPPHQYATPSYRHAQRSSQQPVMVLSAVSLLPATACIRKRTDRQAASPIPAPRRQRTTGSPSGRRVERERQQKAQYVQEGPGCRPTRHVQHSMISYHHISRRQAQQAHA